LLAFFHNFQKQLTSRVPSPRCQRNCLRTTPVAVTEGLCQCNIAAAAPFWPVENLDALAREDRDLFRCGPRQLAIRTAAFSRPRLRRVPSGR